MFGLLAYSFLDNRSGRDWQQDTAPFLPVSESQEYVKVVG